MGVTAAGPLDLATFDGDVTLYDDGMSLEPNSEVISRIIRKIFQENPRFVPT
jgi:IMP and pyridine-specific 5'-nucleotidase